MPSQPNRTVKKMRTRMPREQTLRDETAKRLRRARNFDRKRQWIVMETDVSEIQNDLGFNLADQIAQFQRRMRWETHSNNAKNTLTVSRRMRVLDLGCFLGGTIGRIAREYPVIEAHGLSVHRMPEWKEHTGVNWKVAHAQKTGYPDAYFDLVYSYFGVTHAPNLPRALYELHRILQPQGNAFLTIDVLRTEQGRRSPQEIALTAMQAGFKVARKHQIPFLHGSLSEIWAFHLMRQN